jgi:pimeloyl-ACP methyl ester carboxylesterase
MKNQHMKNLIFFLLAVLLTGCTNFNQLKKEVKRLDEQCHITGKFMESGINGSTNYGVVFKPQSDGSMRIVDVGMVPPEGMGIGFSLPLDTNYFFAVFRDTNGDQRYSEGEPAWAYGTPSPVVFGKDRRTGPIPIRFSTEAETFPRDLLTALRAARGNRKMQDLQSGGQVALAIGEIVTLSDERFSYENAQKGLWEPASALNAQGVGVYFLERYDPKRIPVLFVHGAAGTPQQWSYFAEHFDQKRYQLWFYSYPSGLRLDDCATVLNRIITELHSQYGFTDLHVVAHSMGGLVSRRFIQMNVMDNNQPYIGKFVSISSPWKGHEVAALGVKYAPATIPSWIDMQTGSDFTRRLYEQSIASQVHYSLAFTFAGQQSVLLPESNDGAVSVDSQLKAEAQAEAVRIHGFNETHISILQSDEAIRWVEDALRVW